MFKQKDELNNASTIKRIQKHLPDKYAITHEPKKISFVSFV